MQSDTNRSNQFAPGASPVRGLRGQLGRWLARCLFWIVIPFVLIYVLDLFWDHPFHLPGSAELIFIALLWCSWAPLSVLIVRLSRRLPLRRPHALRNLILHIAASWTIAIGLTVYAAGLAWLLPVEASAEIILSSATSVSEGFGALFQLLYWSVLGGSYLWSRLPAVRAFQRREGSRSAA